MANMTFKADLLPNSDYGYSLGSVTSNPMKRWVIPGTTIETIIGTQTANTGSWTGISKTIDKLYDGLTIHYFLPRNGSGNATLNLTLKDGTTTGAINCYYHSSRLTTHFSQGSVITFTYFSAGSISVGGTATTDARWIANANYDSNDTGYYTRKIYPNIKAGSNKIYPYTIIMKNNDGRWESLAITNAGTGSSHGANTHGFLIDNVLCMYANATYNENDNVGTYNVWSAYSGLIDARYSFNLTSTAGFTSYKPVYIIGTIGTGGLFYLDTTKWWAQDLPSTDDGKVYIYIGDAYDWYRLTFSEVNHAFFYRDSRIQQYAPGRGIKGISRSGTTFTVTRDDGSTFTFTQQDNNTWRGIQDNLTSDSTTDSLSAKQGKALANGSARDSTKLPLAGGTMTGAIERYYSAASTDPVIAVAANNQDATALWIGHGTAAGNPSGNYYKFLYKGTNSSPNNYFRLIAGNASSSEVVAMQVNEQGNVSFTNTVTASISGTAAKATADGDGNTITSTYVKKSGDTMTGVLTMKGSMYNDAFDGALNMNNSDIYGANSIYTADSADGAAEGLHFYRDSTHVDTLWISGGNIYFVPNRAIGTNTTAANSQKVGRFTANPTTGQVVITDGTTGGIKSSGYTIAKSVPSDAVFTDTNNAVTQTNQTGANDYRILLSGSANDTTATEGANKSTNLRFNPSTKVFSVGGDISATGDLTLTGNANLNSETYAESITAGSLLVNGAANFVNIPTAPTPVATSNDTSIATTAFVMNAFTANDAMVFKGVINANSDLPADHKQGWTYKIGTSGTYANKVCEVGDIIICVTEGTAANNDHWAVIQNNIDGAVYKGTNAFTDAHVIIADSTAGKVKDSGKTITATAPSSSAADTTIPTSKAVWSAISGASGYGKTGTVTSITAGAGLNTTSNDTATDGGSITSSGTLYLTKTGVAAGSYGPSAAVTGNEGTTMNVPYITVDKYGRVTSISNKTYTAKNTTYTFTAGTSTLAWNSEVTLATVGGLAIKAKLPANPNTNTDTLVKQTVKTDNVNYKLLGTTSASPSSGTAMEATYSANVYANPSTGAVSAIRHTLNVGGTDKAYMAFNSTTNAIDFVFT